MSFGGLLWDSNYPCANICLSTPSPAPTGSMIPAAGTDKPLYLQWTTNQTQILQIIDHSSDLQL